MRFIELVVDREILDKIATRDETVYICSVKEINIKLGDVIVYHQSDQFDTFVRTSVIKITKYQTFDQLTTDISDYVNEPVDRTQCVFAIEQEHFPFWCDDCNCKIIWSFDIVICTCGSAYCKNCFVGTKCKECGDERCEICADSFEDEKCVSCC
jgi:hypothetical protein